MEDQILKKDTAFEVELSQTKTKKEMEINCVVQKYSILLQVKDNEINVLHQSKLRGKQAVNDVSAVFNIQTLLLFNAHLQNVYFISKYLEQRMAEVEDLWDESMKMQADARDKVKAANDSIIAINIMTSKAIHAEHQVIAHCIKVVSNKHKNNLE